MPIIINLEPLLLRQKVNSSILADQLNMTKSNFYILKTNKARLIRLSTLDSICRLLDCQPGDILMYVPDKETS